MEPLKQLTVTTTNSSPSYIFFAYFDANGDEKEDFTLKPIYQRNVVWGTKQYLKFIESIFFGIVPNPIVINLDTKTNKKTCIDGKQRLTSISKFFTNKIPYFQVKDNKMILYWYNKIQNEESVQKILEEIYQIKNFDNRLITPQMKAWIEGGFQLSIVQYSNLDYNQQIDIFNRIQYGMTISRGSYLKSFIPDAKLCEHIVDMANKYKEYFGKYIKNENNEDHIKYMIEIFLMLEKNIVTIKSETVEYELKKLTLKSFNKLVEKYDTMIKTMYDKELLNLNEIKQKKIVVKLLLFAIDKLTLKEFDQQKMKNLIKNIYNEITEEKKQFKTSELDEYLNDFWLNKNKETRTNKKIFVSKKSICKERESISESESNSENDSDNDSESENEIETEIVKKLNNNTKINKSSKNQILQK
jgi:hypothetical protein